MRGKGRIGTKTGLPARKREREDRVATSIPIWGGLCETRLELMASRVHLRLSPMPTEIEVQMPKVYLVLSQDILWEKHSILPQKERLARFNA